MRYDKPPLTFLEQTELLYYVMLTAAKKGVFVAGGNPNTIDHLTAEKLREHRFPFPPVEEQEKIASFFDRKIRMIDETVCRVEMQLSKLREYRQTLISASVTGKIDVRQEVAV